MKGIKRLSIPVVLGVVLIAAVVGVASARPDARPQEQAWRVLTVPAQACIPRNENVDYDYYAEYLQCDTGTCNFVCPVEFPAAGEQAVGAINVKRFTAYVLDDDGSGPARVQAYLRKTYPMGGKAYLEMALVLSVDSPSDPQTIMDTAVGNNPIYRSQAPYAWFSIGGAGNRLYGFYVHYTW
jgi:hypothetical protein